MAVSLFAGLMGGALLGFATQNGHSQICDYVRNRHPILFKSIGLILLAGTILVPSIGLTGILPINLTPFFWGGCMAFSFIFGFFVVHCQVIPQGQSV